MKILILGGGIGGLSAAWFLLKENPKVKITLLEKSSRLGGWIRTSREGGFLFEKGPRTFPLGKCPLLFGLMKELGLKILTAPLQKRYILHNGKLRSIASFFPQLFPHLIRQPFLAPAKNEESIYDFACRRFSPKIAETIFDPLTLGIYAGDMRKLSMRACFPRFSFQRPKGLFTLQEGMESLIHELQKRLPIEIVLNYEANETNIHTWGADRIISALPPLLPKKSLWVVNLVFDGDVLPKKGYGFLIPMKEKESLLGVLFDSCIFPEQNSGKETRLTAMVRADEPNPLAAAISVLQRYLGIVQNPLFVSTFFAKDAIPQLEVGSNYPHGISVEACIAKAKNGLLHYLPVW